MAAHCTPPPCGGGRRAKRRGRGSSGATQAARPPPPTLPRKRGGRAAEGGSRRAELRLMFMMSSGGLTAADLFQGKDAILSGPAGGVVGMAETGRRGRLRPPDRLRHGRHLDRRVAFRRRVRARLRDRSRRRAHARADDAHPHRRRRRRLDPAFRRRALPRRAGFGRRQSRPDLLSPRRPARRHRRQRDGRQAACPISSRRSSGRSRTSRSTRRRCRTLSRRSPKDVGGRSPEEIADGFIKIAVENMANAIKKISVQRGYDVTRYALNCFGGAGGQHACLVADALGMTTVLIHPFSSLLSAYGMGLADIRATREQAIEAAVRRRKRLEAESSARAAELGKARDRAKSPARASPKDKIKLIVRAHIRYAGTDTALLVVDAGSLRRAMQARASRRRTRRASASSTASKQLVVEAVVGRRRSAAAQSSPRSRRGARRRRSCRRRAQRTRFFSAGRLARRHRLSRATSSSPAHKVEGPAHRHRAAPDHRGRARLAGGAHRRRTISCSRRAKKLSAHARHRHAMPIRSCWKCSTTCSCRSPSRWACRCRTPPIRSTSRSGSTSPARSSTATARWSPTRRTCRCISARWTARSRPSSATNKGKIKPGDVYVINAPYNGGTHLPDITVCTPVFDDRKKQHPLLGRLARPSRRCRRHLAGLDVAERDRPSRRKACCSTISSWSIAAVSARRS